MIDILLIICMVFLVIPYTRIMLIYFKLQKMEIEDITGFDLTKELTSNYDEINIIESKEINISKYNFKRNIIRLTEINYNSKDIFTLSISSFLSGYSLANLNKDKNIQLLSKIFPNIDYLNKSAILALLISILTKNIGDAKIALILLFIILIYQYLINEINNISKEKTKKALKKLLTKENYLLIEIVQNSFLALNKVSFITTVILILREILIIIN